MLEKKNKLGAIRFSKNIILRIIEDAIAECDGKFALYNYKGKYKNMVPSNHFDFEEGEDGVNITIYVVIKFGAGIKSNTDKLINYVYDEVERVMGERLNSVKVIITGVKSREIARRHIEING